MWLFFSFLEQYLSQSGSFIFFFFKFDYAGS